MKNRYGNEYKFEQISEDQFTMKGDLKYCRFGGKENQEKMDFSDLGFVDPSGGPFIQVGMKIEDRTILKIRVEGNLDDPTQIIFEVSKKF